MLGALRWSEDQNLCGAGAKLHGHGLRGDHLASSFRSLISHRQQCPALPQPAQDVQLASEWPAEPALAWAMYIGAHWY